jgi:hypothetical protein
VSIFLASDEKVALMTSRFRKARSSLEQVARCRTDRDVKSVLNGLRPRPESREGHDSGFEEFEEMEPQLV